MKTEAELKAFFKTYKPQDGPDWNNYCQAFVDKLAQITGGWRQNYSSAHTAFGASKIVSTKAAEAPVGAIHYWAWKNPLTNRNEGHVAVELGGNRLAMAYHTLSTRWDSKLNKNIGVISFERFQRVAQLKYLGWAETNGRNRVFIEATGSASPVPPKPLPKPEPVEPPKPAPQPVSSAYWWIPVVALLGAILGGLFGGEA